MLFATNETPSAWHELARGLFGRDDDLAEYIDVPRGIYRAAIFADGQFEGCLFVGPAQAPPLWDAVKAVFQAASLADNERRILLSGRSADGVAETGPLVCACFGVGLGAIRDAMVARKMTSVEEIGKALRAGTNCGSCLPELKRIVAGRDIVEVL
jgi:assimilatory nitrate reductase catalytic subunit